MRTYCTLGANVSFSWCERAHHKSTVRHGEENLDTRSRTGETGRSSLGQDIKEEVRGHMSVVDFVNERGIEIVIAVISIAVGSGVTYLVSRRYYRKALRDAERNSEAHIQQVLRDDMLVLKTSLDNPQNAHERLAVAEEELAKARTELVTARNSVAMRNATLAVRSCLLRRLKVAQEIPEYQRPSALYAKLKEETDRELESLTRPM